MVPLIAALVLAGAATPAQHQQAATALYRVLVSYDAYGVFRRHPPDNDTVVSMTHLSGVLSLGSSFTVSSDGWLMTARHVVDPEESISDLCSRVRRDWPLGVQMSGLRMVTIFEDIAGNRYGAIATFFTQSVEASRTMDLCTDRSVFDAQTDPSGTARIVALDPDADLALVKLDVAKTMYLTLSSKRPARWSDVFAVGYSETDQRTTVTGAVAIRCEETEGVCVAQASGQSCPMVLVMRTTAAVLDGMSGSPQVGDGTVVGVTTMRSVAAPVGFAVPSTYALKWYRHVRWPQKYPKPTVVCTPTPEQ